MNTTSPPDATKGISIIEIVSQSREAVFAAVTECTDGGIDFLGNIPEILAVLQSIPPQLLEDVGIAILEDFTDKRGTDIASDVGREFLISFDKVLAANIAAATNIVLQQLREQQVRQAEAQHKLRNGLLAV